MVDLGSPSFAAATAIECAGAQDPLAFWYMRTMLYERQRELYSATPELLASWAEEMGLDAAAFAACQADPAIAAKIDRMNQERIDAGIRQRPSLDVNGRLYAGSLPLTQLQPIIEELLAAQ